VLVITNWLTGAGTCVTFPVLCARKDGFEVFVVADAWGGLCLPGRGTIRIRLRILRLTGAIPVEGGIPIIVDGKLIRAVSASGGSSDQDGRTAHAGAAGIK
jgi:hypothetical protein